MSSYISKHPALTWKESCSLSIHHHACVYTVAWHTTAQCVPVCGLPWTARTLSYLCGVILASIDRSAPSIISISAPQHTARKLFDLAPVVGTLDRDPARNVTLICILLVAFIHVYIHRQGLKAM